MYIAYAIFALTICSLIIVKIKWPTIDIIYLVRLLLWMGCGFILYIPVISMLMDIFICTEQAKGTVFFDIDWNTEWWDSIHIGHASFALIALFQIIPVVMYLRVKYQETLPDLNILANPKFIFLRTSIIIFMIVLSKIFKAN